ncbi:CsbD family protein [Stieleria sp. TO1_6]|uniref:CsbD family protein n=1 Tax=Stieleria tagensis TaxID=2956795 RepID=UPI00209A7CF6|nr:CsbD family protein [Stieleria tagensis]MCO8124904.1 CsbD family protein [Stieleria tagensis]
MVTKQEVSGKWDAIVGSVKQKYGQITDMDLKRVEGDLNKLAGLIQQKTGQSREQIEAYFDECCASADSVVGQVSEFASGAGEALREGYDHAASQARQGYKSTVKTLSRHPLESAGVALGVGLAVGLVLGISIGAQRERELTWRDRWHR